MEAIFDIATRISTPLALSGFIAAALFFIYREILIQQIQKRGKTASNQIVISIINKLFAMALVGMVLGSSAWILKEVLNLKTTIKIQVYSDGNRAPGVLVSADNVEEEEATNAYGIATLTFDRLSTNSKLLLKLKSEDYDIDTLITVKNDTNYHKFIFIRRPVKQLTVVKPAEKETPNPKKAPQRDIIIQLGEFDSRVAQIKRFLVLIDSADDISQKSYFSNGIRAALNGAKGWYQPTYPQFAEVPFFTLVQWFKLNNVGKKHSNEVLQAIQNASTLEPNGIFDHNKTTQFLSLLNNYRIQFKDY